MATRPGRPKQEEEDSPIINGRIFLDTAANEREDFTDEIEDILAGLKIDPNAVDEEMAAQPARLARVAILAEEAGHGARWAKRSAELAKANASANIRKGVGDGKKPSEEAIKQMVEADPDVSDAIDYQLDCERSAAILKVLAGSVRDRKDMLAELARNQRHEWRGSGAVED